MHVRVTAAALAAVASAAPATHTTDTTTPTIIRCANGEQPKITPGPLHVFRAVSEIVVTYTTTFVKTTPEEPSSILEQFHLTADPFFPVSTGLPEIPKVTGPPVIMSAANLARRWFVPPPGWCIGPTDAPFPCSWSPAQSSRYSAYLATRSSTTLQTEVLEAKVTGPVIIKGKDIKTASGEEPELDDKWSKAGRPHYVVHY